LRQARDSIAEMVQAAIQEAVEAEREACAKLAENCNGLHSDISGHDAGVRAGAIIAIEIRARSSPKSEAAKAE